MKSKSFVVDGTRRRGRGARGRLWLTLAQDPTPTHFSGLINDYTPETIDGKHGWSVGNARDMVVGFERQIRFGRFFRSHDHGALAITRLSTALTRLDDPSDPDARIAHTHHITMKDATVSYATGTCPTYARPRSYQPWFHGHRLGLYYRQRRPRSLFEGGHRAIHAAGLRQRRNGRPVFQRDSGVRSSREWPFRLAGDPRRRSQAEIVRLRRRTPISLGGGHD